mmetsp:Transcript_114821/g.199721  ORF Transcript_114821/g.199721 Transcript_114821/m.199721 type:complete len:230 (-) Transcript_114821:199-888(-)
MGPLLTACVSEKPQSYAILNQKGVCPRPFATGSNGVKDTPISAQFRSGPAGIQHFPVSPCDTLVPPGALLPAAAVPASPCTDTPPTACLSDGTAWTWSMVRLLLPFLESMPVASGSFLGWWYPGFLFPRLRLGLPLLNMSIKHRTQRFSLDSRVHSILCQAECLSSGTGHANGAGLGGCLGGSLGGCLGSSCLGGSCIGSGCLSSGCLGGSLSSSGCQDGSLSNAQHNF